MNFHLLPPLLLLLPMLGGCLSVSLPFAKEPSQEFEDLRGWKFKGQLVGRESTWVHLKSEGGVPYTISIENFSKLGKELILKEARQLKEPPAPVRIVEDRLLFEREGQFVHIQDGQPFTGRILERNRLGQTTARLSCYRGRLHGVCTYFGEQGERKAEMNYALGRLHGLAVYWHPKGKVHSRGFFVDGQKDGRLETFHPSGRRQSRSWWKLGKPVEKHVEWHENGHPSRETTYWNGYVRSNLEWNEFGELTQRYPYLPALPTSEAP